MKQILGDSKVCADNVKVGRDLPVEKHWLIVQEQVEKSKAQTLITKFLFDSGEDSKHFSDSKHIGIFRV